MRLQEHSWALEERECFRPLLLQNMCLKLDLLKASLIDPDYHPDTQTRCLLPSFTRTPNPDLRSGLFPGSTQMCVHTVVIP